MIVFAWLAIGCSDNAPRAYRVGVICGLDHFLPLVDRFQSRMTELGYVQGETIIYDVQTSNADPDAVRRAAKMFVKQGIDLILTTPTQASITTQAVIQGTDIPMVFANAAIEGTRLVKSIAEPGGNITGVRYPGPEKVCKTLELLLEFMPGAKRVWTGYDKNYPTVGPILAALRTLASSKDVFLVEVPAGSIADIERDLSVRAKTKDPGIDAVLLIPDPFNYSTPGWRVIRTFAEAQHIPVAGRPINGVAQGALFGTAIDHSHIGELAARLADKILHGIPAGSIPIVTPVGALIINYRMAQKLGIPVPEGMLNRASRIIRE
jgi:putative ABC transport system substrate-binding protein